MRNESPDRPVWLYIVSEPATGAENMALDEALLLARRAGRLPPVLRFYSWTGPTLSIGRFQRLRENFDLALCGERGVPIVRRPTGGRAILHHPGEVTYGVIASKGSFPFSQGDGGILAVYSQIHGALVAGLRRLGLRASIREQSPRWPETGAGIGCFEQAYRHEVFAVGRKVVASAQRRQDDLFLQQGTIPLTAEGARLAELVLGSPGLRVTLARDLRERTGALGHLLQREVTFSEVMEELIAGFREAWGVRLERTEPSPAERALAKELLVTRYGNPEWTMGA